MVKPASLVKFVTDNAEQILALKTASERYVMMSTYSTCVLRPLELPKSIRDQMTSREYNQYKEKSDAFWNEDLILDAVDWVKNWVVS